MSAAADTLDRHLSAALRSGSSQGAPSGVAPLVEAALAVRALSPTGAVPRQEFRTQLRHRLDAEAQVLAPARVRAAQVSRTTRSGPATSARHSGRVGGEVSWARRRRPVVVAALVAAVLGLGATTSVASAGALPGDFLYPFKRTVEDARLSLAGSPAARGATELDLARERLEESQALTARGRSDDEPALGDTLGDLGTTATSGVTLLLDDWEATSDPTSLGEVAGFLALGIPAMQTLQPTLPSSLQPVAGSLVTAWKDVETQVAAALQTCGQPCADLGIVLPSASASPAPGFADPSATGPDGPADGSAPEGAGSPGGGGAPSGLPSASTGLDGTVTVPGATGGPLPDVTSSAGSVPGVGEPVVPPLVGTTGGGVSSGGLPLPTVGVGTTGATVGVPLPTVTVGVPLPTVTVGTATVPVPGAGVPAPTTGTTTRGCVVNALGICVPRP